MSKAQAQRPSRLSSRKLLNSPITMEGQFMEAILPVIVVLGLVYFIKSVGKKRPATTDKPFKHSGKLSIVACDSIMRRGEQQMFALLSAALPDHHVFPQVAFSALITHAPHIYGSYVLAVRRKFHHKFVDFVICDKATMKVFAIVEFDGSGHNSKHDGYRDDMLQSVGYRVERFNQRDTLDSVKARFGLVPPIIAQEVLEDAQETSQF